MRILRYIVEWTGIFFATWILNVVCNYFLQKKINSIASAIFSFLILGILFFLITPYLIAFVNPAIIYMPFLLCLYSPWEKLFVIYSLKKGGKQ